MAEFDELIGSHKVKIGKDEFTIGEMLDTCPETLNEDFTTQASRLAYLGMVLAKAEVNLEKAKQVRETLYADLDLEVRTELDGKKVEDPKFKYTEAMVKANILQYEEYQQATGTELQALHDYKIMRAIVDAMRQRGDMLVSLGAQLRQEYDVTNLSLLRTKTEIAQKQRGG
jgi:hypothetical protein